MQISSGAELVGTYRLVSFFQERQDGSRITKFDNAHGTLLYTADGSMSVGINGPDVSDVLSSILFYCGSYRVENGVVYHDVTEASDPNRVGKAMVRQARWLTPGELELSASGDFGKAIIVWKKS